MKEKTARALQEALEDTHRSVKRLLNAPDDELEQRAEILVGSETAYGKALVEAQAEIAGDAPPDVQARVGPEDESEGAKG